jgi:hypothetical protein
LKHDAFIDCHEILYIPKEKLIEQINNNLTHYKGQLIAEDLNSLIEGVKASDLFSQKEKSEFFK